MSYWDSFYSYQLKTTLSIFLQIRPRVVIIDHVKFS